ncbi:tyrosine-protein phosphatase [Streptomyces sp. NPDC055013]
MDRHIRLEALHNFRDLGGYPTTDGHRVRPGRLYRSDSLGKLRAGTADWSRFHSLGIGTVIDLRYRWEIEKRGRVPGHPLAFHCASGKDRTGMVAALILGLLGVPERAITEDFTLTEQAVPALLADWKARNDGRAPTRPGFGRAPEAVMRLFLADLAGRYGSIEGYASEGLSLNPEPLSTTLRSALLEKRPE